MKRPRLISISGSVHSGKTTISRMLAVEMPSAMYVDGDMISAYVAKSFPESTSIDDMLSDIHNLMAKFIEANLEDGLDVIVDYVLSDKGRHEILSAMGNVSFTSKWFLLKPDIQKILKPSNKRPELSNWEVERIKYHYGSDLMKTTMAKIIDSTNQTPEETLEVIREEL